MSLYALIDEAAGRWPDRVAVIDAQGQLTFSELADAVHTQRAALASLGIPVGAGLGVRAKNGRDFIIHVFACLGVGAVVMPIAPSTTPTEIARVLARAPLWGVVDDGTGPTLPGPVHTVGRGQFWRTNEGRVPMVPHVADAAFIRFTSGTTGTSKGVVVGHEAVLARTAAAHRSLGLGETDTMVWVLPMAYHFIVSIVMYVRFGVCIAVCPDMLAQSILRTCRDHHGTWLYASPAHIKMLAGDASDLDLGGVRRVISTSAGLARDVADAFEARFGLPVTQAYGIIEVGLPVGNLAAAREHPDAIGHAFPDYEVVALGDDGQPVPAGELGRLGMRGPGMFDAYLSPPRRREEVLEHGWFMTGDLATIDASGLVTVAGREKSMINVAGLKVFPEEVEATLGQAPGVADVRVYGVRHPWMGEVVEAEVVPEAGVTLEVTSLRRYVRDRLSKHKVPQRIHVVTRIARTATGKVTRASDAGGPRAGDAS